MKRFLVVGLILLMGLMICGANQLAADNQHQAEKKNIKFRLSFFVDGKYISSRFEPQNWNLSFSEDNTPNTPGMDIWGICAVLDRHFMKGRGFRFSLTGFGSNDERAYAFVYNPNFDCQEGETFSLWGMRELSFQESGAQTSGSVDVRLLKDLWMNISYGKSRKFTMTMAENREFVAIDDLEEWERYSDGSVLWFMWLSRHFNEQSRTISFRNSNYEFSLKYDLFHSLGVTDKVGFSPFVGIGLWCSHRKETGVIKEYTYKRCFLPEEFSALCYNNAPFESFRHLSNESKIKRSDSKLTYRIFTGFEMELYPLKSLGLYGSVKIYGKSPAVTFMNESWYGDFPVNLSPVKMIASTGLVFKF